MFDNFETIGGIIGRYASRGLLDPDYAREALAKDPGTVATMDDRFALLALCVLDDHKKIVRLTGQYPAQYMKCDQKDAWDAICKSAIKAAKDTPEGRLFHAKMPDSPGACACTADAMNAYRFAIVRTAWKESFTAKGGWRFLEEILDAAENLGLYLSHAEAMRLYEKTAEDVPWKPNVFPWEIADSVEWAAKELSLWDSAQPLSKESYLILPERKRRAYAESCAIRLIRKLGDKYDPSSVYTEPRNQNPEDWYLHGAAAYHKEQETWSAWTLNLSKMSLECGHYGLKSPMPIMNSLRCGTCTGCSGTDET